MDERPPSLVCVEGALHVAARPTGLQAYDFRFEDYFACTHPYRIQSPLTAVARMGAAEDYAQRFRALLETGIRLVHSPEQYERTSLLPTWYPLLEDMTPRSLWFDVPPSPAVLENEFGWPIFVKGERQTNRHNASQSVINSRDEFDRLMRQWSREPILAWQRIVCREFVPLRPVASTSAGGIQKSFEFRTFWWFGQCVGIGRYWTSETYELGSEHEAAMRVSGEAAQRLDVPFVLIDIAQTVDGQWIVIECNDGQDSGYAGVNARAMWARIVDATQTTDHGS